jgi:RHS repeat-associated protein
MWGYVYSQEKAEFGGKAINILDNFTNHDYDEILGIYYANARFYDPVMMRFLASDPARDGLNWYTYADGNPLRFVDPLGLVEIRLDEIAKQYGGVSYLSINDTYVVSFGSIGWKEYGNDSIITIRDEIAYVDDAAFIDDWGITDMIWAEDKDLGACVRITSFYSPGEPGLRGTLRNIFEGAFLHRLTVNGNEIDVTRMHQGTFSNVYLNGGNFPHKTRETISIQQVDSRTIDLYNGALLADSFSALSQASQGLPVFGLPLALLADLAGLGLSAIDLSNYQLNYSDYVINVGGSKKGYYIDGETHQLRFTSDIDTLLKFITGI